MELNLNLFYDATPLENAKQVETMGLESYDYIVGEKSGWFSSKKQAIVQASDVVLDEYHNFHFVTHTFVLENCNDGCSARFWIPLFNDFNKFFKPNLPIEILNKFPHLKIMANPYEYSPRVEYNEFGPNLTLLTDLLFWGPKENDFIHSFDDNAQFVLTTKAIKGDTITQEIANDIFFAHNFIKQAIKEYKSFKKTRLYEFLKRKSEEPITFKDLFNGLTVVSVFKMCKLAFSLYNGFLSNDDAMDLDSTIEIPDMGSMTNYLCDDIVSYHDNSDISFGGNIGNRYDQNTIDFLQECRANNIELPSSVDHSTVSSQAIVDRSINGGLTSIDKSIIRDKIENLYNSGSLSPNTYQSLKNKLSSC